MRLYHICLFAADLTLSLPGLSILQSRGSPSFSRLNSADCVHTPHFPCFLAQARVDVTHAILTDVELHPAVVFP